MKRISSLLFLAILFVPCAHSEEISSLSSFEFKQFEVGFISALQMNPSSNSESGVARWVPTYQLNSNVDLGLNLGITGFKSNVSSSFASFEYGATGTYHFNENWLGRLTIGAQTWTGTQSQTSFSLAGTGIYRFSQSLLHVIEGMFASYTPVFSKHRAHEISIGVELKF